jgi:hypothetical protein
MGRAKQYSLPCQYAPDVQSLGAGSFPCAKHVGSALPALYCWQGINETYFDLETFPDERSDFLQATFHATEFNNTAMVEVVTMLLPNRTIFKSAVLHLFAAPYTDEWRLAQFKTIFLSGRLAMLGGLRVLSVTDETGCSMLSAIR